MNTVLVKVPFHCLVISLLLMRASFHLVLFLFLNWIPLLVVIDWRWCRNVRAHPAQWEQPKASSACRSRDIPVSEWDLAALHSASQNWVSGLCLLGDSDKERDTPKDESLQDTLQTEGCVLTNFYFHLLINFSGINVYHLLSDFCVVLLVHKAFPRSDPHWMDNMVITT